MTETDNQAQVTGVLFRSSPPDLEGIISVSRPGTYGEHKHGYLTTLCSQER